MNRQRLGVIAVTTVVVGTFLTSLGFVADGLSEKIEKGNSDRADLRAEVREKDAQLDDQQAKTALAIDQLRDAGIKPDVDSSVPRVLPSSAPSPATLMLLIRQALEDFCADGRCVGKDGKDGAVGPPGADAPPVTDDQIAAAVAAYCAARDDCRGPKGDKGDPGEDAESPGPIIPTPGDGR